MCSFTTNVKHLQEVSSDNSCEFQWSRRKRVFTCVTVTSFSVKFNLRVMYSYREGLKISLCVSCVKHTEQNNPKKREKNKAKVEKYSTHFQEIHIRSPNVLNVFIYVSDDKVKLTKHRLWWLSLCELISTEMKRNQLLPGRKDINLNLNDNNYIMIKIIKNWSASMWSLSDMCV